MIDGRGKHKVEKKLLLRARIIKFIRKNPDLNCMETASAMGISGSTLTAHMKEIRKEGNEVE